MKIKNFQAFQPRESGEWLEMNEMVNNMAILDKLLEKKDLMIYIDERIKQLNSIKIKQFEPKNREKQRQRKNGRVVELRHLKWIVHGNHVKEFSLKTWASNRKNKKEVSQ